MKRCIATIEHKMLFTILESLHVFCSAPRIRIFSRFWSLLEESGLFWWNGALHWRGEYHDLCRFWLWFYFLPRNSYKSRTYQPRTEIFFQILWKHKRIPENDHHNCPIDLEHTSKIVVNRYKFWDLYAATLITLNHMTDGDTMSNQYPQITTHQPRTDVYLLFCLLRPMKRERERKWWRARFAFFQKKTSDEMDERTKQFLRLRIEELNDLWKPGARYGSPPFVMKSSCFEV